MKIISRFWGYASNHPLWSAVIAIVIGTAILSDRLQQFLSSVLSWVVSTHAVSGWMIIILSILSLLAVIFIGFVISEILNREVKERTFLDYTSDEFFSMKWSWSWRFKSQKRENIILEDPRCPQCSGLLEVHQGSAVIPHIYCNNDSCKWSWNADSERTDSAIADRLSYKLLKEKVLTNIDRKAMTGEYK